MVILVEEHEFSHPVYLTPRQTGFTLEFCNNGRAKKTGTMPLPGGKKVWQYVQAYQHNASIGVTDEQIDWPTEINISALSARWCMFIIRILDRVITLQTLFNHREFYCQTDVENARFRNIKWQHPNSAMTFTEDKTRICATVRTQYKSVTDGRTDRTAVAMTHTETQ